jgi:thymidylate synthase (FAD)
VKLIKPYFEIEEIDGVKILKNLEKAGRTCYKSEDKITEDSATKFIAGIIKRGHETILEHEKITVRIICDRGVSHEIVRHRLASYSQESTRYCNYSNDKFYNHITFIVPSWFNSNIIGEYNIPENINNTIVGYAPGNLTEEELQWYYAMVIAERTYLQLINKGWKPEQARSVLPNSLKTEIVMTMNLREWRHFFRLRAVGTTGKPHPQMTEWTIPLLAEFKKLIPVVFDDIKIEEEI